MDLRQESNLDLDPYLNKVLIKVPLKIFNLNLQKFCFAECSFLFAQILFSKFSDLKVGLPCKNCQTSLVGLVYQVAQLLTMDVQKSPLFIHFYHPEPEVCSLKYI